MEEKLNIILALAKAIQLQGKHYVFVYFSGHVNNMCVEVTDKPECRKCLYEEKFYLEPSSLYKEEKLDEVIRELEGFLDD